MNEEIEKLKKEVANLKKIINEFVLVDKYSFPRDIHTKKNINIGSDGTKIGTSISQKLGFWNVTPVVQPTSSNQSAVSLDVDVTGVETVDKTAINTNFSSIQTLLNQLRSDLVSVGIIKGS